ncbi:MAG TPA: hypothetical protein VH080_10355 [Gemmatimonadaceae bacterium]|jgi:hypothetical protein|nr:hypothetical protein [Gemmatimonadaceae bacterium]
MRIALAIAFTVLTACYADGALAPRRAAPTIKIDGPIVLPGSTLVDIDGVTITTLRDLQRLAKLDPETITVYKGVAASDRYPSHPCAAIVITTKHAAHPTQR